MCVNDEGVTALHVAARQGHLECINLLVARAKIDETPETFGGLDCGEGAWA